MPGSPTREHAPRFIGKTIWVYWRTEVCGYHWLSLLIGLLLALPLAFHLWPALNQISRDRGGSFPLNKRAAVTRGLVHQVSEFRHSVNAGPRRRARKYVHLTQISYEYTAIGRTFRRIGTVPSEDAFGLSAGASVPVAYLTDQPSESRLAIHPADPVLVWKQRLGILSHLLPPIGIALFGFVGTVRGFLVARRRARLIDQGQAASGCILGVKPIDSPSGIRLHITYQFTDASGEPHENGAWMPLHLQDRWLPRHQITVAYDPANPGQSEPDLFDLRMPPTTPDRTPADHRLHESPRTA